MSETLTAPTARAIAPMTTADALEAELAMSTADPDTYEPVPIYEPATPRLSPDIFEDFGDFELKKHFEASSSLSWSLPTPLEAREVPGFPVEALPSKLGVYVNGVAEFTQTPPDLSATLALAIISTACAKRVAVEVAAGWREPINIYAVAALRSGERKSPVLSRLTAPLAEWETARAVEMAPAIRQAQSERRVLEKRLQKLEKAAADADDQTLDDALKLVHEAEAKLAAQVMPQAPRLWTDDTTPERMLTMLAEHGGRLALLSAEGGIFETFAGRYSNGTANIDLLLKAHPGDTVRSGRVGRGDVTIEAPALTLGMAVQPDVLHDLASKPGFRGRGLLGRILYALPHSRLGERSITPPPVPADAEAAYRNLVLALLDLPEQCDDSGRTKPHVLRLSEDARARLDDFRTHLEPRLGEFGDLAAMTDWAGKLAGHVVRLAGLLHMAERVSQGEAWTVPIVEATMLNAIRLGNYFLAHARAAFALMGGDVGTADAHHVWRYVCDRGWDGFTERELFQGVRGRIADMARLRRALDVLVGHGYVRVEAPSPRRSRGRPPSPIIRVNPYTQNTQYPQKWEAV